jgi:hypothetical protein
MKLGMKYYSTEKIYKQYDQMKWFALRTQNNFQDWEKHQPL